VILPVQEHHAPEEDLNEGDREKKCTEIKKICNGHVYSLINYKYKKIMVEIRYVGVS